MLSAGRPIVPSVHATFRTRWTRGCLLAPGRRWWAGQLEGSLETLAQGYSHPDGPADGAALERRAVLQCGPKESRGRSAGPHESQSTAVLQSSSSGQPAGGATAGAGLW